MWCDGLLTNTEKGSSKGEASRAAKRGRDSNENDSGKKKQDLEENVQEIVESLKQKHSEPRFATMQIQIRAEMVVSGMYSSLDEPPKTSMFGRAGGGSPQKKKKNEVAQALSDAATAIKSVISTNTQGASPPTNSNSSSVIERRSTLYRQLSELRELQNTGVLTDDEYKAEKDSIMKLLMQLKSA